MDAKTREKLKAISTNLDEFIQCADTEPFPPSYKDDPATFARMLKIEKQLTKDVLEYFKELASDRILAYVNWGEYSVQVERTKQGADLIALGKEAAWIIEQTLLTQKMYDQIYAGMANGAQAAINIYHPALQHATLQEIVEKAALDYSSTMVKGITETTRDILQSSVSTSIKLGETREQAQDRIQQTIASPVRAEMIAKTETVNSYGEGILQLGDATGATGKYLSVIFDDRTSPLCDDLGRKYGTEDQAIPLNEVFDSELGGGDRPAFHVRCRTGLVLSYKTKEEPTENLEQIAQNAGIRPNADINTEIEKLRKSDDPEDLVKAISFAMQIPDAADAAAMLNSISAPSGKSIVDGFYKMQVDPKTLKVSRVLVDKAKDPLKMTPEQLAKAAGVKLK